MSPKTQGPADEQPPMRRIGSADFAAMRATTEHAGEVSASAPESVPSTSECPACRGVGWLSVAARADEPRFGSLVPCACRQEERQARRRAELLRMGALEALRELTFEGLVFVGNRSLEAARDAAWRFAARPAGWLVLLGSYGCGKTHLAAAVANEVIRREEEVLFCVVPDLLDHLRAAFAPQSSVSYDERFERVRSAPLLILDDLGTENATPWAREKLYQVINSRANFDLPTIITSNQPASAIDGRIISRVEGNLFDARVWPIDAPDYRRLRTREQRSGWSEWGAPPSTAEHIPRQTSGGPT